MSEVLGSKCWVFQNRHWLYCTNCSNNSDNQLRLINEGKLMELGLGLGRWLEMLDLVSINITLTAII